MVDQSDSTLGHVTNNSVSFSSTDEQESVPRDVNKPEQHDDAEETHLTEANLGVHLLHPETPPSSPAEASFPGSVGCAELVTASLQSEDDSDDTSQVSDDASGALNHDNNDPGVGNSGWQPASALFSSLHQPAGESFSSSGSSLAQFTNISSLQLDANASSQVSPPDAVSAQGQILYSIPNIANAAEQAANNLSGDTVSAFATNIAPGPSNALPDNPPVAFTSDPHDPDDESEASSPVFGYQSDYSYANGICEPVADAGSLLQTPRLSHFTHDRLPMTLSAEMGAYDEYDDNVQNLDGADSVYASDDEFPLDAPIEASPNSPSDGSSSPLPAPSGTGNSDVPAEDDDHDEYEDENQFMETFEPNLTVDQFVRQWLIRSRAPQRRPLNASLCPISEEAAHVMRWPRREKVSRPDDHGSKVYDIQDIPWSSKLKVRRSVARIVRDAMYKPYHNLRYRRHGCSKQLLNVEDYFLPKTMYTKYKATMSHFQLRNLMSVTGSGVVQYARHSKVFSVTPFYKDQNCILDYSNINHLREFTDPVKISTMKAKHGVTMIGGFNGEYAFRGEVSGHKHVEGYITKDQNSITNHIDIFKHRTRGSPQAVVASNDMKIRTLDCELNKFVDTQTFARAINCTDTSPDGRLRVVVGDAPDAWIIDSESGKPLEMLRGHQDFGFACAWSPDMLHIATSNQDKTVNIWDARMWRILSCIDSDVAGYRSLRFSPVGGGPRTLLMCEPADRISIVNAQTYQTRQVHDFFGEIGGADYTPDGGRIWVANMDYKFGGLMEFDRCQWGAEFGMNHTRRRKIEDRGDVYYPDLPNEWVRESELDEDPRCELGPGERALRWQRLMSDGHHSTSMEI